MCNKFVTICIYVMLPAAALAADYTWSTTNSSGSYTAATNWSPSSPAGGPGSGDKVIFGDTTNAGTLMLLDTNATVANWSSSTATNLYRVRVGAGASRSLAITGTLTKTGANVLDMVGNGSDLLSLTIGTLSLQAGTMTVGNSVLGRFSSFGVTTADLSSVMALTGTNGGTASIGTLNMNTGSAALVLLNGGSAAETFTVNVGALRRPDRRCAIHLRLPAAGCRVAKVGRRLADQHPVAQIRGADRRSVLADLRTNLDHAGPRQLGNQRCGPDFFHQPKRRAAWLRAPHLHRAAGHGYDEVSPHKSRITMKTNSAHGTAIETALRPATLGDIPERVRQIAMLRGLGYSYRQIAGPLQVTPQAVSLMLTRHRRSLQSLRGAMELNSLSARAVNVLGRHGIRTRDQARKANVLERLAGERNCGRKTMDEIARWVALESEASPADAVATASQAA